MGPKPNDELKPGDAVVTMKQDEVFTESALSDLYNNARLTDMRLINPDTVGAVNVHKAILASGSQWFLRVFCSPRPDVLTAVEVPRPITTGHHQDTGSEEYKKKGYTLGTVSDEIVMRILKYIYHN